MNIVFVGLPGVPYRGRACDARLTYFANLLAKKHNVSIVNWFSPKSMINNKSGELDQSVNIVEVVEPKQVSGLKYKIYYIWSLLKEPFVLFGLNKTQHIDIIHIYTEVPFIYVVYKLVAFLIGAKLIYQYVEDRSTFESYNLFQKFFQSIGDKLAALFSDGVIPISHYLENKALNMNPNLHSLKIPPICDFNGFKKYPIQTEVLEDYLLYCGSVNYLDVIKLLINSDHYSKIHNHMKLILILSGDEKVVDQIKNDNSDCIVLTNLEYGKLISYFKGAQYLLIPLRDTLSEIARFPNKICEYIASNGVFVSTNIGEISYYFKDGENAIIANSFCVESFVEVFNNIDSGGYDRESLQRNAYELGFELFCMDAYEDDLNLFLSNLFS